MKPAATDRKLFAFFVLNRVYLLIIYLIVYRGETGRKTDANR